MNSSFFTNDISQKLRNKKEVSVAWAQLGSNVSSEILAEAGFDVLLIDMEHSPTDLPSVLSMMQATKGTGCVPFVRAPWNDMVAIKQILDLGAYGIHIPYVSTKEEAEHAVKACKYAPLGFRGIAGSQRAVQYGMKKSQYYKKANEDIIVIVAIETPEGVANINEIAAVDGVDGIFIGPADLSTAMGYLANPSAPEVQKSITTIEEAVLSTNKFLGTVAPTMDHAKKLYKKGYSFICLMSDAGALSKLASETAQAFKKEYRE